ncbi:MAG: TonB-dependent receptor family protein [Bacteroidota bacterium]|nr:TonB-dependent receptor family protein [Bacteroidota bacterium]
MLISSFPAFSQVSKITGQVIDSASGHSLAGATVALISLKDSNDWNAALSDSAGFFDLESVPGVFNFTVYYIGYQGFSKGIRVDAAPVNLGIISMTTDLDTGDNVTITTSRIRVLQNGDTVIYDARAFKTSPDATAEDLLIKMPGMTSENGQMKVNGEDVKKVYVDGKPFFGEDPNVALKNLPADVVDKVQVYDPTSEQARLTGVSDGQEGKAINIITRPGMGNGQFGNIQAGFGTDNHYIVSGTYNSFKGTRRISIFGLSNDINQQNFSSEDLIGVTAGSEGRGGMRGMRGGPARNFMTGSQTGILVTNSIGINYSDTWGKKMNVSGSYFFNNSERNNFTELTRTYITSRDSGLIYDENSTTEGLNFNHRINFRLEYAVDSLNTLIFSPRVSFQQNISDAATTGASMLRDTLQSRTANTTRADNMAYNLNSDLLWNHRFRKFGRSFSINLNTSVNDRSGENKLQSLNEYYMLGRIVSIDQLSDHETAGYTVSTNVAFVEPLDSFSAFQFTYNVSFNRSTTDKQTSNFSLSDQKYSILDTLLSNKYENRYITHRPGITYTMNRKKIGFSTGLDYQYAELYGQQDFPAKYSLTKKFRDVLPKASFNYNFDKSRSIWMRYRTDTDVPSINQLQDVVDNSNPLFLSTGNPGLEQSYEHSLFARYRKLNTEKNTSFFAMVYGRYTQDYIGNSSLIATHDSTLSSGVVLFQGSQLTRPVNLDGQWMSRAFISFGRPLNKIKSNLNLHTGFTFNRTPALINDELSYSKTYNLSQGIVLGSNISENLDFTLQYNANYNIVRNTLQTVASNYFFHTGGFRLNWIFWKGFVINTDLTHTLYTGIGQDFNQDFLLWNASLGYKFFKNKSLEARVSVYDLLNENSSVNRTVTETYIEDSESNILKRYLMFSMRYNFKKFKGK